MPTYSLSGLFSADLMALPDETNGTKYPHGDTPYSVYGALAAMDDSDWEEMCDEVFPDVDVDYIDIDMVMSKIEETNTCGSLDSPVEVWIDDEGYYTVAVHDCGDRPRSL